MIVRDWVDQAREQLGGGVVEQVNRLASPYTPGDTTLTLEFDTEGVTRGIPVCVGINTFMVWAVAPATKELTVEPRWSGSYDSPQPTGTLVRVRPNIQTHRIFNAVNDVLNELSSPMIGVFGTGTLDLDYDQSITNYDLTDAENIQSVLSVQFGDVDDPIDTWEQLSSVSEWEHRVTQPTSEAPSGHQLRVFAPLYTRGRTIRVTYRTTFNTVSTLDDDVSTVGLPDTALDLPVLGAAARLAVPGEWRRSLTNAQPDPRRAAEVPPGSVNAGARALQQKYEMRCTQEAARLIAQYPFRSN